MKPLRWAAMFAAMAAGANACGGAEADILRLVSSDPDASVVAPDSAPIAIDAAIDVYVDAAAPDACAGKDLGTDREHCGSCNRSCLGGACTDGGCEATLVATAESPVGIAVDDERVFFGSATADGGVYSVTKEGADKRPLVVHLANPQRVTVAGAFVLYSIVGVPGVVGRVDKSGALGRVLATTNASPSEIVVDGNDVFFVDQYHAAIAKTTLDGVADAGAAPSFATGVNYPWGLAISGNDLVWSSRGTIVPADGGGGGFTASDGVIYAAPKDGSSSARVLASGQSDPLSVAADSSGIYWVTARGREVVKLAPGAATPTVLAANQPSPWGLVVDQTHVYFTCAGLAAGQGSLARVRKDGAAPVEVMATSLAFPSTLAHDERAVYWTNSHGGTVMKIAK